MQTVELAHHRLRCSLMTDMQDLGASLNARDLYDKKRDLKRKMTPNGVTRVNRLRRVGYAAPRHSLPLKPRSASATPSPAPPAVSLEARDAPLQNDSATAGHKNGKEPVRHSAALQSKAAHVVPSATYAPTQRKNFRAIWRVLHAAAAARAFGVMSEAQFEVTLKITSDRLERVCIACHREFVTQVPTLVHTPPDRIELVVYTLHDSTTVQASPSFDDIKSTYRARVTDIVMRGIVRP